MTRGQESAPILRALQTGTVAASRRVTSPGHGGGRAVASDVLRALGDGVFTADLRLEPGHLDRVRAEAETLAAQAWGARAAWLLTGEGIGGAAAWCLATLEEGEEVLVARDAPPSVRAALVLSGARPRWIHPVMDPDHGVALGVAPAELDAALTRYPRIRQVILASPGPAGTCTDVSACVQVAARHEARVFVDQGHGAHLRWHPDLPEDPITVGAAGAVVGLDSAGTALTSATLLLAGPGADVIGLDRAVRTIRSSTPLLPVLASADAARRDLVTGGREQITQALEAANWLRHHLRLIPGLDVPDLPLPAWQVDPLTIPVDVSECGYKGWDVAAALRQGGTIVQQADARRIYLRLGCAGSSALSTAAAILAELGEMFYYLTVPRRSPAEMTLPASDLSGAAITGLPTVAGEMVMTPREAQQAPAVPVPVAHAAGRVAAEDVIADQNMPVVVMGERLSAPALAVLAAIRAAGGFLNGCADPTAASIRVIEDR